jgi:hypothetical protein
MSMLSNNKNIFLASQITRTIESLLKLVGTTLGFGIIINPNTIYIFILFYQY